MANSTSPSGGELKKNVRQEIRRVKTVVMAPNALLGACFNFHIPGYVVNEGLDRVEVKSKNNIGLLYILRYWSLVDVLPSIIHASFSRIWRIVLRMAPVL